MKFVTQNERQWTDDEIIERYWYLSPVRSFFICNLMINVSNTKEIPPILIIDLKFHFKGYLRYKTITSQNVPSKAQIKNFLFRTKTVFHSQDIQVSVFLTIPWFTKSVTSRWVLVHEARCIFEYIFWTTNYEVTKLGQLIDISKHNNFQ